MVIGDMDKYVRNMNILFVLHQTILLGGGTKSFMLTLKGLMENGVHPTVIMPDKCGIYQTIAGLHIPTIVTTYRDNTYPVIRRKKDYFIFIPKLIARRIVNHLAVKKIVKEIEGKNIDIVHTNVSVCSVGYEVSRKLGIPHIYHIREYADKDFGMHFFPTRQSYLRQLAQPDSYSICITKDIQKHFGQEGNPNSCVIYNGIQPSIKEIPAIHKENFLLYAGRVDPAKGVYELLLAYNTYYNDIGERQALHLYIVGDLSHESYKNRINNYIARQHLESHVHIMGPRKDIISLMQKAKAIIIPSLNEGFGRCMPEAMFNGCLAIGRDTGGTKEQMDNGLEYTGKDIALRFKTMEQLVSHFMDISKQPLDFFHDMIQSAFITVNHFYSSESNTNKILSLYGRILFH